MAITFTWGVNHLKVIQSPKTDFVNTVYWYVEGVDSDTYKVTVGKKGEEGESTRELIDVPYSLENTGILSDLKQGKSFTAFSDLKEADVVRWVKNILGEDYITNVEKSITDKITSMKNPPATAKIKKLPW